MKRTTKKSTSTKREYKVGTVNPVATLQTADMRSEWHWIDAPDGRGMLDRIDKKR